MVGSFTITNDSFTDSSGQFHPASEQTVLVPSNGHFSFHIAPNQNSIPSNTYYSVVYHLRSGVSTPGDDYWVVPITSAVLSLEQVRVNKSVPPLPFQVQIAQLYSATANVGDCLVFNGANYLPTTIQSVFPFTFTNQQQVSIPASAHGQGPALLVQVYDGSGNVLDPSLNVDPVVGNVLITFGTATSGRGVIYGGLGRSLPNFSQFFAGAQSVTITKSQHRFNTGNLIVSVYDVAGNLIDSAASIQVTGAFDVVVSFTEQTSFTVVIVACLGVDLSAAQGPSSGGSSVNPTVAGTLNIGNLDDGDFLPVGSLTLTGATANTPVVVSAQLPAGLQAFGNIATDNVVTISVMNLSGESVTPGSTVITATALA